MTATTYYKDDNGMLFANPSAKKIREKNLAIIDIDVANAQIKNSKEPTDIQRADDAQSWAKTELDWVDIQLKYNVSGDTARSKFSDEVLYAYAIDCRNYVQNIDGVLTIMTDKPSRPE